MKETIITMNELMDNYREFRKKSSKTSSGRI